MQITSSDRVIAGLAALYFAYRVIQAVQVGIYYGDGDRDVHADKHPFAYVLTLLSGVLVMGLCAYLALAPDLLGLSAAWKWLGDLLQRS